MGLFTGASLFNSEHIQPANLVFSWLTLNKYSLVRTFDYQKKNSIPITTIQPKLEQVARPSWNKISKKKKKNENKYTIRLIDFGMGKGKILRAFSLPLT